MIPQLELFAERLPQKPYCADRLGDTIIRTRTIAATRRYIQANSPNETQCLVFDIDRPDAAVDWEDLGAPAPSIIARNPENGHAHLFYLLETPVHHNHHSRLNPIRYAAAIEAGLRNKLQADPCYSGPLSKNPLHPHWERLLHQPHPYDLGWLAEYVDLVPYTDQRRRLPSVGLGRNCTLFDRTRLWAYSERRKPQGWFGIDFWVAAVRARAHSYNDFPVPLDSREVDGVARSIAKWVWVNMSPEGFKAWGDGRREQSLRVRRGKAEATRQAILAAYEGNPGASQRRLAEMVGCNQATVHRALMHL